VGDSATTSSERFSALRSIAVRTVRPAGATATGGEIFIARRASVSAASVSSNTQPNDRAAVFIVQFSSVVVIVLIDDTHQLR
jgi:hypothetical protein